MNILDGLIKKIKEQPIQYGILIISFVIVLIFYVGSIGKNEKEKMSKKENEIYQEKVSNSTVKQENKEQKTLQQQTDETLKAATNPEARADAVKQENEKMNKDGESVIKSKYNNTVSPHEQEISFIEDKKIEEKKKLEKIENENKIKELEEKLKEKEKQLDNERKQKESEADNKRTSKDRNNPKATSSTLTPELRQVLLQEALKEGEVSSNHVYVPVETKVEIKETKIEEVIEKKVRFKIVAGSSFYGRLKNTLYSGYTDSGAILEIDNANFKKCNFIGNAKYLDARGLAIDINRVACEDGYEQQVNAKAFRISDLKPVFSDKIERHLFPKVVIGTLDGLINMIRIDANDQSVNEKGYIQNNKSLVDTILAEELKRYQTEETAYPQSMVIIFY